jgi:hypothetical protein
MKNIVLIGLLGLLSGNALAGLNVAGVIEERQRLLNARKHRVIVLLRERGLLK